MNQRLELRLGYDVGESNTLAVHLREAEAVVAEAAGLPAPDYVLANGAGLGYGLMALDPRTRDYLLAALPIIDEPLMRAIGWVSLWESLLEGDAGPEALIDLARRALPAETDEQKVTLPSPWSSFGQRWPQWSHFRVGSLLRAVSRPFSHRGQGTPPTRTRDSDGSRSRVIGSIPFFVRR
ncbi:MAG: hypothetical protein F4137_05550 [Acidobacteria bacterium]|nr:hypothetical protein [Acidobacteriota bacterium]MYH28316.1 hypothetical protein [Acidobacteriota bacterium]